MAIIAVLCGIFIFAGRSVALSAFLGAITYGVTSYTFFFIAKLKEQLDAATASLKTLQEAIMPPPEAQSIAEAEELIQTEEVCTSE